MRINIIEKVLYTEIFIPCDGKINMMSQSICVGHLHSVQLENNVDMIKVNTEYLLYTAPRKCLMRGCMT